MSTASFQLLDQKLCELAESRFAEYQHVRRSLHQFPEVSGSEYSTTEYLCSKLVAMGFEPKLAADRRGCYSDFGAGKRRVLIRGDIDALPIATQLTTPYASRVGGVMHACGHDAHATVALAAGGLLQELDRLQLLPEGVAVRVVLQPAEETSTGALHMIDAGVLEGVSAAIALHVDPARELGSIGVRDGSFTAGCDSYRLTVRGQPGHSARPHLTGDALAAAVSWINDVHVRVPRCHDVCEPIVFNVGTIHGGTASNSVPEEILLTGTLRATTLAGAEAALRCIEQVTGGIRQRFAVAADVNWYEHNPPFENDRQVNRCLKEAALGVLASWKERAEARADQVRADRGEPSEGFKGEGVADIREVSMGAEDFAFFAARVPTAMFRLGVASSAATSHPLHTPLFDIDERALCIGAATLAAAAIRWCVSSDISPILRS